MGNKANGANENTEAMVGVCCRSKAKIMNN